MQSSNPGWHVLGALLAPLLFPSISHAEIYKWVDAKGQTHYTERKGDAGDARTVELKISPPPEPPQTSTPSEYLRAQSKLAHPPQPSTRKPYRPPMERSPKSLSDGKDHGTDASRCALARDVLSGAVRHGNGKPTDQYDREVAQNDTKAFCNSR
ncbi:DUF4124 domain-containing protein [Variovorax paradoxus]|nr:DUF4124 domain-containing protein [Variovorax paradoxus]